MSNLITVLECTPETSTASSPLEALLEAAGSVTIHLNESGVATFTSKNVMEWAGAAGFTNGSAFVDLFDNATKQDIAALVNKVRSEGMIIEFSAPLQPAYGRNLRWKLCRYAVGQKSGILAVGIDETSRHELELQLQQHAFSDALTQLPVRASVPDLYTQLVQESCGLQKSVIVSVITVTGLSRINSAMGSDRGDAVLIQLAHRLNMFVQGSGRVARTGSTEFTMLLKTGEKLEDVYRKTRQLIALLEAPYHFDLESAHVKSRIGFTQVLAENVPFDEAFAAASKALRQAKDFSQIAFVDVLRSGISEAKETVRLETALHEGVRNGELYLVYQPLVSKTGLYGAEALMRWKQANGTEVSPSTFIPVAEANGLIQMLGEWALRRAAHEFSALNALHGLALQVSVNVSPVQFLNPGFVRSVASVLQTSGLAPELLQLEITEGTLMAAPEIVEPILHSLRERGVHIAVDDFGTGYSSLAYLKRFPVSALKIAQSFVKGLPGSAADMAVCAAISELAEKLGMKVIAEGIETKEQYEALRKNCNCSGYQGYLFGKPAPLSNLISI